MSKKNIGKKIFGLALVGAAIGGAIAFFKKFENDQDSDFTDVDPFDSDLSEDCDECAQPDVTRSYTTIAGEKPEDSSSETEEVQEEEVSDETESEEATAESSDADSEGSEAE